MKCQWATANQDDRTFFKVWEPFQPRRRKERLLSVIFSNLGDRGNVWHIGIPQKQNSNMKGTMWLAIAIPYKVVVHCQKTISPWDYPWLFGFLQYPWKVARTEVTDSVVLLVFFGGSRGGVVVRALASHQCDPGFDSRTRRFMSVEFVVGFLLCSESFFPRVLRFPPLLKTNISKFQFGLDCSHVCYMSLWLGRLGNHSSRCWA